MIAVDYGNATTYQSFFKATCRQLYPSNSTRIDSMIHTRTHTLALALALALALGLTLV